MIRGNLQCKSFGLARFYKRKRPILTICVNTEGELEFCKHFFELSGVELRKLEADLLLSQIVERI